MRAATGIRAMTVLACVGAADFADAADIRVYTSGAPAQAVKSIAADFTASTGDALTFTVGQPAMIQHRLAAGEKADVVILPNGVISKLSKSGAMRAGSAVDVARVGIGIVVRGSANAPDISNAAAIRSLLLAAGSIVCPDPQEQGGGSAGLAIARMIEKMGIADTVKPKLTHATAIGGGVDLVAAGTAEVGLFNVSEIVPIKGVTLVGPLPDELQSYIVFTAAITAADPAPAPAAAFIRKLTDPSERPAWQKAGMEPLGTAASPSVH
jgi:molybdate transport system substrate-binding protein